MLSLSQQSERLRRADHLLPLKDGGMASRPGAIQIVDGDILEAKGWGDRAVANRAGRVVVWDGDVHDLCAAGLVLQGTSFQALTENAARENRFYVADAVNSLWFIAYRAGAFVREFVVNTILDGTGAPYPIPVPFDVATWRNRLWIIHGTNRTQHCQNDRPSEWDPLWTVECQGEQPDVIHSLEPHGGMLLAGLTRSMWGITGDSQYNWQRDEVAKYGVAGLNGLVSDGIAAYYVSHSGLRALGQDAPLSDDLELMFRAPVGAASIAIDRRRRILLLYLGGRLFTMHLDRPGRFGEIVVQARGVIQLDNHAGWYGPDGLWLLHSRDTPDQHLDGTLTPFTSVFDTWEDQPNLNGNGRALLNRTILQLKGSARAPASYTAISDGKFNFSGTLTMADEDVGNWADLGEGMELPWPTRPVRRELVPRLAGQSFRHILESEAHMEVLTFDPQYRFGGKEK